MGRHHAWFRVLRRGSAHTHTHIHVCRGHACANLHNIYIYIYMDIQYTYNIYISGKSWGYMYDASCCWARGSEYVYVVYVYTTICTTIHTQIVCTLCILSRTLNNKIRHTYILSFLFWRVRCVFIVVHIVVYTYILHTYTTISTTYTYIYIHFVVYIVYIVCTLLYIYMSWAFPNSIYNIHIYIYIHVVVYVVYIVYILLCIYISWAFPTVSTTYIYS